MNRYNIKSNGYKHEFLINCGDIDMRIIDPIKSNVVVECNCKRDNFGSSKRFKGFEEVNEKKLTFVEAIHVDEVDKDHCNWDSVTDE